MKTNTCVEKSSSTDYQAIAKAAMLRLIRKRRSFTTTDFLKLVKSHGLPLVTAFELIPQCFSEATSAGQIEKTGRVRCDKYGWLPLFRSVTWKALGGNSEGPV